MNKLNIERAVSEIHGLVKRHYLQAYYDNKLGLIDMLNPKLAIELLDFEFLEFQELGSFGNKSANFEVAGTIDRKLKKVAVATRFDPQLVRFTSAHELGHLVMHPDEIMHRDMPVSDWNMNKPKRPLKEQEADYFAGCFLMPKKMVLQEIKARFKTVPF